MAGFFTGAVTRLVASGAILDEAMLDLDIRPARPDFFDGLIHA